MASSVVPTGLRMNGSEKLTESIASLRGHPALAGERRRRNLRLLGKIELGLQRRWPAKPRLDSLHGQIDDRRGVHREQLAHQQSADDGYAERMQRYCCLWCFPVALRHRWRCCYCRWYY